MSESESKQQHKLELYSPHHGQQKIHNSTARFKIVTCGRRWGKTLACANELMMKAWVKPDSELWWVAPVHSQSTIAFDLMHNAFKNVLSKVSLKDRRFDILNGSIIEFKSAENPEFLRGRGLDMVVIDEAAFIKRNAWYEALRPALSDKLGCAMIIGTPKGKNWFWEEYIKGDPQSDDYDPSYESFTFPSSSNPFLPEGEVAEARRNLPEHAFKQEFLAEFLESGAGVFVNIAENATGSFKEPEKMHDYIIGWDPAKHQDFSVMTVMDRVTHEVVAFHRDNSTRYEHQIVQLHNLVTKYNRAYVRMDSTGIGDPIMEMVQNRGIPVEGFTFTTLSKKQLIERLAVLMEKRVIKYPEIRELMRELEVYTYDVTEFGTVRYSAPEGYHDDCVTSLALCCFDIEVPLEMGDTNQWYHGFGKYI